MSALTVVLILTAMVAVLLPKALPALLAPAASGGGRWRRFLALLPAALMAGLAVTTVAGGHPDRPRPPVLGVVALGAAAALGHRLLVRPRR